MARMKRLSNIFILILVLTLAFCLASPVLGITYYVNILVQESGGGSYTQLPVLCSINNSYLASNNYMQADGLDTRVITNVGASLPHMVADDKLLFISGVSEDSIAFFKYTLGNEDLGSMPIIAGYDGYVTVADNASLELGNNFKLDTKGNMDMQMSSGGPIVIKHDAFVLYASEPYTITASILGAATQADPTVAYDPDDSWSNEEDTYDNNTGTGANLTVAAGADSWSNYLWLGQTFGSDVDSYGVRIYAESDADWTQIDVDIEYATGWLSIYSGSYSNLAWNYYTYPNGVTTDATVRVRFFNDNAVPQTEDGLLREADFLNYNATESATLYSTIPSDQIMRTVVSADGTNMTLAMYDDDGTLLDSDTVYGIGAGVPNNDNSWLLLHNLTMPYMEYYSHTTAVGGSSEKIRYEPVSIIVGTTLPNGNDPGTFDGAITWGTNPDDIYTLTSSLIPSTNPVPSGLPTEPSQDIVEESGQPGWTVETDPLTENPLYPVVAVVADLTGLWSATGKTLYEYYNTGDSSFDCASGLDWLCQTFTPETSHTIKKVKLLLYKVETPGIVTVGIYNTEGGKPTGSALTYKTFDGADLTSDTAGEWWTTTLGGTDLNTDVLYAIVLSSESELGNAVCWREEMPAGLPCSYSGGAAGYSENGGLTWTMTMGDFMFEEYGGVKSARLVWLIGATFIVVGCMLAMVSHVPHQLITVAVGGGLSYFFVHMHIYPFWVIFIFAVMGIAVVIWEREPVV